MNVIRKTANMALIYTEENKTFRIIKNGAETVAIFNSSGWKGYTAALEAYRRIIYLNRRC